MATDVTHSVTPLLSDNIIRGLLCSAFEGGSNYWYTNLEPHKDNVIPAEEFYENGSQQLPGEYWHWSQLMPMVEGCAVAFEDEGGSPVHKLDRPAIERGARIMREKYPRHFRDAVLEDGDANTGDVFLQCCIFGEVIYG